MSGHAVIELGPVTNADENASLVMLNALGQTVRTIPVQMNTTTVQLERGDLTSGLYHVQLRSAQNVLRTIKLVIE
jgi:hypothetical protein